MVRKVREGGGLRGGRVGGLENAQAVKLAIAGSESAKSAITSNRNEKSKIVFLSSATLDTVARREKRVSTYGC